MTEKNNYEEDGQLFFFLTFLRVGFFMHNLPDGSKFSPTWKENSVIGPS